MNITENTSFDPFYPQKVQIFAIFTQPKKVQILTIFHKNVQIWTLQIFLTEYTTMGEGRVRPDSDKKGFPNTFIHLHINVKKNYLCFCLLISYKNEFQIKGSYSGTKHYPGSSILELIFEQTVDITEYYYPKFSITDFLSQVGGSLRKAINNKK